MCRELRRRGYAAYDIENMAGLFAFVDKSTGRVATDYGGDDPAWFERHSWTCNKEKLEKLMLTGHQGPAFYCGVAANLDELLPLFDRVFLLSADAKTLRKRLGERRADDFGRGPAIQEWLLGWKGRWEDQMRQRGAAVIDAGRGISEVADEIVRLATNSKRT